MTTIKPEDVSSQENDLYAKIQKANRKHNFLEWYEVEVIRDMVRERIELKNKLSRRNLQIKNLKSDIVDLTFQIEHDREVAKVDLRDVKDIREF